MPTKLIIGVLFDAEPSTHGQQDIKRAVQDLKDAIEYLGKVTRADLVKVA